MKTPAIHRLLGVEHAMGFTTQDDPDAIMAALLKTSLAELSLEKKATLAEFNGSIWAKQDSVEDFVNYLLDSGFRIFWQKISRLTNNTPNRFGFYKDNTYILFYSNRDKETSAASCELVLFSIDPKEFDDIRTKFLSYEIEISLQNTVYALIAHPSGGLEINKLGMINSPLIRDNYSDEVLEAYDTVLSDLANPNPAGRLAIFDGPPGTGKTFLVKGMITDCKDVVFLLIPSDTIHNITGPSIIPLLLEAKREDGIAYNRPICLLLEDADSALVPRGTDNMSLITSLLNCTDGIFGTLFDLKVVATTNAKEFEIDEALTRAGRLSAEVKVDLLPIDIAQSVLDRLNPKNKIKIKEEMRLADIYALVRERKTTKQNTKAKGGKMGF